MTAINISGRLSFEHIFVPDSSNGSAPAYSATVLLPKGDAQIQKIREEIQRVATEKWKDKAPGLLKSLFATEKLCLRDGDNKEYDGYAGMMYVTSRNKARPTVVDRRCNPVTEADGLVYSGCYVNARIELWAQDNANGKRVNAKLLGIQFVRDGDAFGAGSAPARPTDFPDLGDDEATQPAAGGNPWD
ncbi:DUF2815 family protein [Parasutterella excrementihominis]|uniref:DUF2815 family protein n=1 Tax=Parasutterella excrementihominis TaxID=487175 RepID=UPI00242AC179|nr:DUF2815 family protein [Parasutterella excrementihominis]